MTAATNAGTGAYPGCRIFRNQPNGETFIFPPLSGDDRLASFLCRLERGGSGGADALLHVHPLARETFSVRVGCLRVHIDGVDHLVGAGESVTIGPGQTHRFANASSTPSEFLVEFSPAQRHREFFMTFGWLSENRLCWFSPEGKPDFLLMALMLHRFRDHLYVTTLPIFVQKLLFGLLAPVALVLGYRLERGQAGVEIERSASTEAV